MALRSESEFEFVHRRELSRFVVRDGEHPIGRLDYVMRGGNAHLVHTEVDPARRGQQIASLLTEFALRELQSEGTGIVAECPFVVAYLKRHPLESGDGRRNNN